MQELAARFGKGIRRRPEPSDARRGFAPLRLAAGELLLAASAQLAIEVLRPSGGDTSEDGATKALEMAALVVGPLAAATHLRNSRRSRERSDEWARGANRATLALGTVVLLVDAIHARRRSPHLGALGLLSGGLLGVMMERYERDVLGEQRMLRRRAAVVERLVPRRQARFDRLVVHV